MKAKDWRPAAPLEHLRQRADVLGRIRQFFHERGVLEVETPLLSRHASTEPHLDSLTTRYTGPGFAGGVTLHLQTSPEYAMKRLLAAGSGPIYQICKAFRDGEAGPRHNPEFTLLEWYRPGCDHHALMNEVALLVATLLSSGAECRRMTYAEAFGVYAGCDPHRAPLSELYQCLREAAGGGLQGIDTDDRDTLLDLLMSHAVEPRLDAGPVFIHDFPASQAALARVRPGDPPLAERFELYIDGVEVANGYHEVTDPEEQAACFRRDRERRRRLQRPDVLPDERLLAAMEAGMPPCAGVALGIDRLLMVMTRAKGIDEVLAFPVGIA